MEARRPRLPNNSDRFSVFSDSYTEFLVRPYFINPKPDLSMEPVHFVVCVHGLDGKENTFSARVLCKLLTGFAPFLLPSPLSLCVVLRSRKIPISTVVEVLL